MSAHSKGRETFQRQGTRMYLILRCLSVKLYILEVKVKSISTLTKLSTGLTLEWCQKENHVVPLVKPPLHSNVERTRFHDQYSKQQI